MSESYCRVLVRGLMRQHEDQFSLFCFENSAEGVSEDLAFTQPELRYEPSVVVTTTLDVSVYFATRPSEDFFLHLQGQFPEVKTQVFVEANRDWLEEWKKGFVPFCFVEPFWIVPSWCETPPEAKQVFFLDPGMAFGTGTHETTFLAASLLAEDLGERETQGRRVLDVGTGTGILALMAHRLKASRAVAIDIDLEARRVARENIEKNALAAFRAGSISVPDLDLEDINETFDIIIANIIDGVLLDLKDLMLSRLSATGFLVLSGILTERELGFTSKFLEGTDLVLQKRVQRGEWVGLLMKRTPRRD